MGAQSTWPSGSDEGEYPPGNYAAEQAGHDEMPAYAVIGEMARLLRETRRNVLTGACVLAAITIGTALETRFAARALQPGMFRVINIGLMLGLVFCWLTAVAQQAVVCTPVLNAVSELRWRTGAPLDPRAAWLTLPPVGDNCEEWEWTRAHLLLGAARLALHRVQRADTWTYVTASYFILWTVIIMTGL